MKYRNKYTLLLSTSAKGTAAITEFPRLEADVARASAERLTSQKADFSENLSEKHSSLLSMSGTSTLCSEVCQLSRGNCRRIALVRKEPSLVRISCRKEFLVFPSNLLLYLCVLTMVLNSRSTEAQNLSISGLSKRRKTVCQTIIYIAPLVRNVTGIQHGVYYQLWMGSLCLRMLASGDF